MSPFATKLSTPALLACSVLALAACDRSPAPGAESARSTDATVQASPPTAGASTPMPVSPSGMTNSTTAGQGGDLSNSTRASGTTNVYQPPSTDNPSGGAPAGSAGHPASAASQSVTSESKGTSPPPNSGTLPGGTEGNTGSRRGGGKG